MWKHFETNFKSILNALSRHRRLIADQAAALHYRQYQFDSQQYKQERSKNIEYCERQEASEMQRKRLEVLQWFSAADTTDLDQEQFTYTRREYHGSGNWILKNEKIRNWLEDDTPVSSMLWLNGKPGAGITDEP